MLAVSGNRTHLVLSRWTTGRAKSQGGVAGIEDVVTSLFLKPFADHLKHGLQEEVIE